MCGNIDGILSWRIVTLADDIFKINLAGRRKINPQQRTVRTVWRTPGRSPGSKVVIDMKSIYDMNLLGMSLKSEQKKRKSNTKAKCFHRERLFKVNVPH